MRKTEMPVNLSIVLFLLCCTVNLTVKSEKNESNFVPTREWQPVKKGQPIPSGLHVRHNFQTGLTEAKLMDEESKDDTKNVSKDWETSLTLHPNESLRNSDSEGTTIDDQQRSKDAQIPVAELKSMLKKIKLDERSMKETQEDHLEAYKNLKNEFRALNVNITTDSEMLVAFFKKFEIFKNSIAEGTLTDQGAKDVLKILNNLEYLLHQIDNAQTFAEMGGMTKIISPCFNATNDDVKVEAFRLLGSAVQSNPKVQAKALEHDFVKKLLHILVVSKKATVQYRCLFALGALVRQYPAAQKALVGHGGLEIFGKILEDGYMLTQTRVMKLMNDLVVERSNLDKIDDEVLRRRKTREYDSTDFIKKLLEQEYCKHSSNLMIKTFHSKTLNDDDERNPEMYEFFKVIIESLSNFNSVCKDVFDAEKDAILRALDTAISHHTNNVKDTSSIVDNFLLYDLVEEMTKLKQMLYQMPHDEL